MKRIIFIIGICIYFLSAYSQTPNVFKYQAILRDNSGSIIPNQNVSFRLSILAAGITGTIVYAETQLVTTNNFGLVTLSIGNGVPITGSFGTINWSNNTYFLKIEIDLNAGSNYTLLGVSQLLSVPFAKYADISGKALNDLDTSAGNELQTLALSNNTLSISQGNQVLLPCCCPENSCITSLSITPPNGYYYTGDFTISASSNVWLTKEKMPLSLFDCVAATVNNKIYVIGGYNGSGNVKVLHEYDPVTNTWNTKANMSSTRASMTCQVVNNRIYVIGGHNASTTPLATVEEYDPNTDTWSAKSSMNYARTELSSAVVNNKIYVFGGWSGSGNSNKVEEYDPSTDTWTTKSNMTFARRIQNSIACNNKIYVVAGYSSTHLKTNEEYDPSTDQWTTKKSMTYARGDVHIGVVNQKIYVIGGGTMGNAVSYNEEYDPITDTWSLKAAMPTSRAGGACTVWNNSIYVFGGNLGPVNATNTNEVYIPSRMYYTHCKTSGNKP